MKRIILVFALLVLTLSGAYAAQKFTLNVPKGAQNVKRHFDENGNEHASYTLGKNKVAVECTRIVLRIESKDSVSEDKGAEDKGAEDREAGDREAGDRQ